MKNNENDSDLKNWQIVLTRKTYMKNIQFEQVRKHSIVDNVLDKKNKTEHSTILCDQADKFLNQLWADFRDQNIAEFMFQNNILWVSWS
jgi:hypothetical protein